MSYDRGKKWAQLSKLERAYKKVQSVNEYMFKYTSKKDLTKRDARERNRYYQLLRRWAELKKESENASSLFD